MPYADPAKRLAAHRARYEQLKKTGRCTNCGAPAEDGVRCAEHRRSAMQSPAVEAGCPGRAVCRPSMRGVLRTPPDALREAPGGRPEATDRAAPSPPGERVVRALRLSGVSGADPLRAASGREPGVLREGLRTADGSRGEHLRPPPGQLRLDDALPGTDRDGRLMPYASPADRLAWFKRRADERRAAGLCLRCDAEREPGSNLCGVHREARRRGKAEREDRRRAARRCIQCGSPDTEGKVRCRFHRKKIADDRRRARQVAKDKGECVRGCGRKMGLDSLMLTCLRCRDADNAARRRTNRNRSGG